VELVLFGAAGAKSFVAAQEVLAVDAGLGEADVGRPIHRVALQLRVSNLKHLVGVEVVLIGVAYVGGVELDAPGDFGKGVLGQVYLGEEVVGVWSLGGFEGLG